MEFQQNETNKKEDCGWNSFEIGLVFRDGQIANGANRVAPNFAEFRRIARRSVNLELPIAI